MEENTNLTKGQKLYYSKIHPSANTFDVCDLTVRTVSRTYFTAVDKHDKHAYLFSYSDIGQTVFINRNEALEKTLLAEENKYKDEEE